VRAHLEKGRPVLALLAVDRRRFHYVVVVGWAARRVIVHDPARASFRVLREDEFLAAWAGTDYWSLLVLPAAGEAKEPDGGRVPTAPTVDESPDACSPLVSQALRLAKDGDLPGAESLLTAARESCPESSAPVRELAGVRLLQSRTADSALLAEQAVALDPGNLYAWRLLATGRFLLDDRDGALRAWNHVGEPRIDLARLEGLRRLSQDTVTDAIELPPRGLLTEPALGRARRRLGELPALSGSRIGYRPLPGGQAEVEVAVLERPFCSEAISTPSAAPPGRRSTGSCRYPSPTRAAGVRCGRWASDFGKSGRASSFPWPFRASELFQVFRGSRPSGMSNLTS